VPSEPETKAAVSVAVADYKKATNALIKIYEELVKTLTIEKKIAEAKVVRDECSAFRSVGKRTENASSSPQASPAKPPKPSGTLVGSRWKYHHNSKVFTLGKNGEAIELDGTRMALWTIEGNVLRVRQPEGQWEDIMVVSPDEMTMVGKTNVGKPVSATRLSE